jgi:hypothetical protein
MKIDLIRKEFTTISTIGDFLVDGKRLCYSLEDCVRDVKIPGETAIPYGTYEVITNYSVRFKRVMPLLLNVPGFEGVRVHSGNTDADTEACILLGYIKNPNWVGQSRDAFNAFFPLLTEALSSGKVWITISKGE